MSYLLLLTDLYSINICTNIVGIRINECIYKTHLSQKHMFQAAIYVKTVLR